MFALWVKVMTWLGLTGTTFVVKQGQLWVAKSTIGSKAPVARALYFRGEAIRAEADIHFKGTAEESNILHTLGLTDSSKITWVESVPSHGNWS